jgi:hypothetical protein
MLSRKDSPHDTNRQWRHFLIATGTSRHKRLPKDAQLPSVEGDLKLIQKPIWDTLHCENALSIDQSDERSLR